MKENLNPQIFATFNGKNYFGYDVYYTDGERPVADIISEDVYEPLRDLTYCDKTIHPAKGSSIYVSPGNCPVASDDIRRNYSMKKILDMGDYNIFYPVNRTWYKDNIMGFAVIESYKIIVISKRYRDSIKSYNSLYNFLAVRPDIHEDDIEIIKLSDPVCLYNIQDMTGAHKAALMGQLTKPCVPLENLDLSTGNDITLELLEQVRVSGIVDDSRNAEENFRIQLNILNEHDWREYPGTTALVLAMTQSLSSYVQTTGDSIYERISSQSKPIKNLYNETKAWAGNYKSQKDFDMAKTYLDTKLNIGEYRYCTSSSLSAKLLEYNIPSSIFYSLYNEVVRIAPKKY